MGRLALALLLLLVDSTPLVAQETSDRPVLGKRVAGRFDAGGERARIPAGAALRSAPSEFGSELLRFETGIELAVLERRGEWVEVRWQGYRGWVRLRTDGSAPGAAPSALEPVPEEAWREVLATTREVEQARSYLRDERAWDLGAWRLFTDFDPVADAARLDAVRAVAASLEVVYRQRYGLEPFTPPEPFVVVLYRREEDYRRYVGETGVTVGSTTRGHSTPGMAVLFDGGRPLDELTALVVHELVHLLNQRSFLRGLASWLEEGMAEELCWSRLDEEGRPVAGTLRGSVGVRTFSAFDEQGRELIVRERTLRGPAVWLTKVVERWDTRPDHSLQRLMTLDWASFALGPERELNYTESAYFLRFLLDARTELSSAFRQFLHGGQRGESLDATRLEEQLGMSLLEVEEDFRAWARTQARSAVR
jgi:hypothetical protein